MISLIYTKLLNIMKRTFLLLTTMLLIFIATHAQDSTQRKDYLGKYKFPEGSVVPEVEVLIENGLLMMNSSAGTSSLELIKGDTFTIVAFNGTAAFKRNDAKKVIGVHIDAGGYILDGVKDSTTTTHFVLKAMALLPETVTFRTSGETGIASKAIQPEIWEQRKRMKPVGLTE
jgi:hypothetical protein